MSCLFNSLSRFLNLSSNEIRNEICNYLEENKPIIDGLDTKFILELDGGPNYIQNMRKTSTWGGAIEIQAACSIWNIKCIVIDIRSNSKLQKKIEFCPVEGNFEKIIHVTWSGGHYEPYVPNNI
jgi:hypothetical protein